MCGPSVTRSVPTSLLTRSPSALSENLRLELDGELVGYHKQGLCEPERAGTMYEASYKRNHALWTIGEVESHKVILEGHKRPSLKPSLLPTAKSQSHLECTYHRFASLQFEFMRLHEIR
jgi:hypothetical protein